MAFPRNPKVLFVVSPSMGIPIYQQLVDQIKRMVASGQLAGGAPLPSVREVAVTLAINPMTVSKAYSLLETQGVLSRRRGMGMVVSQDATGTQAIRDRLALLRPTLERAAEEAAQLHIDQDAAIALFEKVLKGKR
ncbi:MAG: GntR family transcriptional regulator [Rhodocyclaceae bacterium]|nr:GntR family transcriptional regulator [Rhodocyclaceae bacterium]MCA3025239.1 GntR family transcriptional regulator [Rhodocyclaceae bacterium]MCA3031206.1 GntR family transcriptional regulator [Rhodocyclaceae bacterium]MCA3038727.1 GntR family transcriptional regulator [Rhodocyclaceae bacterium]MCA3040677.1 GntR family transcriptional regulator [Rhodocyclaceae bacterium]